VPATISIRLDETYKFVPFSSILRHALAPEVGEELIADDGPGIQKLGPTVCAHCDNIEVEVVVVGRIDRWTGSRNLIWQRKFIRIRKDLVNNKR
jgi:hypothetical protein